MIRLMQSFSRNTRGSVLVFVALGMGIILTVSALAIDVSRYMAAKSKFEHAVDQALLAAASMSSRMSSDQMSAEAQKFFNANFPTSYNGVLSLTNMQVSFDPTTFQWTGSATGSIKTTFGQIVGVKDIPISHTAKVIWDQTSVEVVFVVDISAHMCASTTYDDQGNITNIGDGACTKLNALKYALKYLIGGDTSGTTGWSGLPLLTSSDGRPGYRVGIVPFNHKVKMPDINYIPDAMSAAEVNEGDLNYFNNFGQGSASDPAETDKYPLPPVTPLVALDASQGATNRTKLLAAVDNLNTYYDVPGWTRSSLGLLTGALMLDPDSSQYFSKGYSFNGTNITAVAQTSNFNVSNNQKVVFLLTDGANIGCCFSSQPNPDPATGKPNYNNQYLYSYRLDNQYLTGVSNSSTDGICGQIKDQGIQVYTIAYDVNDKAALGGGGTIKSIFKNCASGPENVNYFSVASGDKAALTKAYGTIAQQLTRLRLSY